MHVCAFSFQRPCTGLQLDLRSAWPSDDSVHSRYACGASFARVLDSFKCML